MTNDGKNIRCAINYLEELKSHTSGYAVEWLDMAVKALEQESITWIVGKDNCQVAVKNMPIDKMQKICAIIGEEEQQPCDDCISREAVEKITWEEPSYTDALNVLTEVREKIRQLPSVTPQPKRGEWIRQDDKSKRRYGWLYCSKCGAWIGDKTKFCSECGAKMEGVSK